MNWKTLNDEQQLREIDQTSTTKPVAIFKHSTRCAISSMAKFRLERGWDIKEEDLDIYYLDLLRFRSISNSLVSKYGVEHESPQLLMIKNGKIIYHDSHNGISIDAIKSLL